MPACLVVPVLCPLQHGWRAGCVLPALPCVVLHHRLGPPPATNPVRVGEGHPLGAEIATEESHSSSPEWRFGFVQAGSVLYVPGQACAVLYVVRPVAKLPPRGMSRGAEWPAHP
jgi:hypothetical protein